MNFLRTIKFYECKHTLLGNWCYCGHVSATQKERTNKARALRGAGIIKCARQLLKITGQNAPLTSLLFARPQKPCSLHCQFRCWPYCCKLYILVKVSRYYSWHWIISHYGRFPNIEIGLEVSLETPLKIKSNVTSKHKKLIPFRFSRAKLLNAFGLTIRRFEAEEICGTEINQKLSREFRRGPFNIFVTSPSFCHFLKLSGKTNLR